MPELPEVETVRRGLQPVMEGATVIAVETRRLDLRFPLPDQMSAVLTGRRIMQLRRRAKYLIAEFDSGPGLIGHLGMSGSFRIEAEADTQTPGAFHHPRSKADAHDHVIFHLARGAERAKVIYNDPRRFGFMLLADRPDEHPMLAGLGLEPIGNALCGPVLSAMLKGKATPLKAALLDQTLIAGLGNIYVSEALWRAGISPRRAAGTLATKSGGVTLRAERLASAVRDVIADAIEAGGSSLRDYVHADGSLGYFQHRFAVYDREGEPCPRPGCRGVIARIVQSGRSTFYCPVCQR